MEDIRSVAHTIGKTDASVSNVKWLDFAANMLESQRSVYTDSSWTDVLVSVGSQQNRTCCRAHQIVLSACSDYFRSCLAATMTTSTITARQQSQAAPHHNNSDCDNTASIVIPDLNGILLEPLMRYIYTGETFVDQTMLPDFLEACDYLQIKGFSNYTCMVNGIQLQKQNASVDQPKQQQSTTQSSDDVSANGGRIVGSVNTMPMAEQQVFVLQSGCGNAIDNHSTNTFKTTTTPLMDVESNERHDVEDSLSLPQLDSFEEYLEDYENEDDAEDDDGNEELLNEGEHNVNADPLAELGDCWETLKSTPSNMAEVETKSQSQSATTSRRPRMKPTVITTMTTIVSDATSTKNAKHSYTDACLAAAMAEFDAGASVAEIAAKFDIPRSTIYARMRSSRERIYRQNTPCKLSEAISCVVETGLSLKEASQKFDLSKTVLWRALQKTNLYRPQDRAKLTRADALVAIQRGDTLISISKEFNIPLATLHRDKVRLYREGKLPDHCKLRKRDIGLGYQNRVLAAVASCRNGMPQQMASQKHGVPKTTIWRHLQRQRSLDAKGGISKNDVTTESDEHAELDIWDGKHVFENDEGVEEVDDKREGYVANYDAQMAVEREEDDNNFTDHDAVDMNYRHPDDMRFIEVEASDSSQCNQ